MKKVFFITLINLFFFPFFLVKGQREKSRIQFKDSQILNSFPLEVGHKKTVHLIFPAPLQEVDLGSSDIIADKFDGVDNVLRIKALKEDFFPETNIGVITKDGKFYSFYVNYSENPKEVSYQIAGNDFSGSTKTWFDTTQEYRGTLAVTFENVEMNQADVYKYSNEILKKPRFINHLGMRKFDMAFLVNGIYMKDNVVFFSLQIKNNSHLNYDIDFIRIYIKDKKKSKRSSYQEMEVDPLFIFPKNFTIPGKKKTEMVYSFQKFTIPKEKEIEIEMIEKNGGRHLRFIVDYDDLINASLLDDDGSSKASFLKKRK